MFNKLLKQEEIDALLNAQVEPALEEPFGETGIKAGLDQTAVEKELPPPALVETGREEIRGVSPGLKTLKNHEMDALGEVGNICMGSAATTLSMLLNQKVSITSPRITVTTLEELFQGFDIPHMTIYVSFTEGLSGYNLLITKLQDAAVLADLMMGGDGTNITEELNEISESAASEAMNQMIGSASTAMATMFGRTVNISPPETRIYYSAEELNPPVISQEGAVVVVWFKMTIGTIMDTQIMQVMSLETAREQAGLILGQLSGDFSEEQQPLPPEAPPPGPPVSEYDAGVETTGEFAEEPGQIHSDPASVRPASPPAQQDETPARELRYGKAPVHPDPPDEMRYAADLPHIDQRRIGMILDIPLKVTVVLGRTRWPIKDILGLSPGSVVELQSLVDDPVEVLVNGALVARGEVVVVNENFGVRITDIIGPEDRLKSLGK